MEATILVVDDEEKIISIIENYLVQEGYRVYTAKDGLTAIEIMKARTVDLLVLDWMMPQMTGIEVCRKIRDFSDVPIFFLTAKSEEIDKLLGLEIGADDYITKPFSVRELAARVRIVLRRVQKSIDNKPSQVITIHNYIEIDMERYIVKIDQVEVTLTPTEFKLLATLAKNPGRVYSRLQLLEQALGEEYLGYERSIDTHIRNLRKKIEVDANDPQIVMTVFGVGYKVREI
ncbi:response regulator transcription factor [Anaerobacillus alkaliphilus]|uniref:response regulator transcription factor n=1 Tax=Anaerobacillus alkaliphilus TaxID=1548597 RepID=UPI0019D62017|nr:response regulator transcription factor [Anaerobacillus alkaliphilus]